MLKLYPRGYSLSSSRWIPKGPAMCSPATCPQCKKLTYSGCGNHVDQIFAGVPSDRRCSCAPAVRPARHGGFFLARR